jgi:hypothetical protein
MLRELDLRLVTRTELVIIKDYSIRYRFKPNGVCVPRLCQPGTCLRGAAGRRQSERATNKTVGIHSRIEGCVETTTVVVPSQI